MAEKTVIIGGVAGGATAAARLRRRDEEREILILERGEYISYANCGLPYYVGDVIKSRDALLLQTPQAMKKKYNIQVRTLHEAVKLMPDEKKVAVKDLRTGEVYEESYDQLILATGSSPVKPAGLMDEEEGNLPVFTVWTVPDTDRIKAYIREKQAKKAVVVGGGFIGLEMAENLCQAGLFVSLIEMQNQVMPPLDYEMANLLHENMRKNGVELLLDRGVSAIRKQGDGVRISLSTGEQVEADLVILSIGVRPNSSLAKEAGLAINSRGGVWVNEYLETSCKDIYAVGDVIQVDHYVSRDKTMIPLAGPANKQARIAADNIMGDRKVYRGTLGTSVAQVFDLQAASGGLNEKQLKATGKEKGLDYETVLINQKSHAGYYPGACPLTLKMIFTRDGKILGAQVVGKEGADKRMDVLATVMRMNGTIFDLEELELSYAPPFSSAKDPVNMLGYVAENLLSGLVAFTEWDEMDWMRKDPDRAKDIVVLDVTEDVERQAYAIKDSVHIPLGQLRERYGELDQDKWIIVYCAVGIRAYNGARILMQNGFRHVTVLSGGITFYRSMHHMDKES